MEAFYPHARDAVHKPVWSSQPVGLEGPQWWSCVGLSGLSPEAVAKGGEDSLVLRISQDCGWSLPLQTWLMVVWGDGLLPARKQVSKQAVLERPTSKKKNYHYSNALFQRVSFPRCIFAQVFTVSVGPNPSCSKQASMPQNHHHKYNSTEKSQHGQGLNYHKDWNNNTCWALHFY